MNNILSWTDLEKLKAEDIDRVNGITNAYSSLRLFNNHEKDANLILYRDRHAWCPYCQKIWLWLELKEIPYKIKKINMFCYGDKENWYLNKVRSGKLPAIEINGHLVTESDEILGFLEKEFGLLGSSIFSEKLIELRKLERDIFSAWCNWLCRKEFLKTERSIKKNKLKLALHKLDELLKASETGFLDPIQECSINSQPGTGDIIFIPYLERMNASLCYYKGFNLRKEFTNINNWLTLLETNSVYRGTQGDFHTHSHDLPPQMGGCFKEINDEQIFFSKLIDNGNGLGKFEINNDSDLVYFSKFALTRIIKHKKNIINTNPCENNTFEESLRSALTYMLTGKTNEIQGFGAVGLRYLRDRISVPRDMPLISARLVRQSLEKVASSSKPKEVYPLNKKHRFDQDPKKFKL